MVVPSASLLQGHISVPNRWCKFHTRRVMQMIFLMRHCRIPLPVTLTEQDYLLMSTETKLLLQWATRNCPAISTPKFLNRCCLNVLASHHQRGLIFFYDGSQEKVVFDIGMV